MKTSKETIYEYVQKQVMTVSAYKEGITTKDIADNFKLQRSNVSAILNELVKEKRLEKTVTRPVRYFLPQQEKESTQGIDDHTLIGMDGSLSNCMHIAKAAIYYPGRKLNVLVSAKPGSGTTYFTYCMYLFGKSAGIFKEEIPYYKINCRHFKNNIDRLMNILFSPSNMEESMFAKARGGMLFIDNADLLNSDEKSRLADFLENGLLYSSDRTETLDCKDTFLVLSCPTNNEQEFSSRMSMVVRLPELIERPIHEKLDLINYFFSLEAFNASRTFETKRDVIEVLLMHHFEMSVKGLSMAIKRACATACIRSMDDPNENIEVTLYDFDEEIQKNVVRMHDRTAGIAEVLGTQALFIYDCQDSYRKMIYDETHDMYEQIRNQYSELAKRGINEDTIHNIVTNHINSLFQQYNYYRSYNEAYDIEQLSKIVDDRIIQIVSDAIDLYRKEMKKDTKPQLFYGLCLHMNSLLKLNFSGTRVDDDQVVHIIQDFPVEYAISTRLSKIFKDTFHIDLPMEEIVIITMFFINDDKEESGHPVLLYIFHGNGIASSLREVTNALMHTNNAYAYDLSLDKSTQEAMKEIKELLERIDQGKGVVVIYDMGSIKTMLDTISKEITVNIRYIYMPVTLVGLDIARKCIQDDDIDYIYHSAILELKNAMHIHDSSKEIIITLCYTGEGGAQQLKQYIDQYSNLGIKTVPLAITKRDDLIRQVMKLQKLYHVHCFVGTYDPKLLGIPFVSMKQIFENKPEDLDKLLMFESVMKKDIDYEPIYDFLRQHFKHISVDELKKELPSIMDELSIVYSLDTDQKTGLFIHIASMLENIKEGIITQLDINTAGILKIYGNDAKTISNIVKPLEKKFNVIIEDNQIALMIRIIKKL